MWDSVAHQEMEMHSCHSDALNNTKMEILNKQKINPQGKNHKVSQN